MTLTHAQHSRLDRMPEQCKVIGRYNGNPVISYPEGRMQVVDHTGRLRAASMRVRLQIDQRRIERAAA